MIDLNRIALDVCEGSSLVATGQKDPKDTPGKGQDLVNFFLFCIYFVKKTIFCFFFVCILWIA